VCGPANDWLLCNFYGGRHIAKLPAVRRLMCGEECVLRYGRSRCSTGRAPALVVACHPHPLLFRKPQDLFQQLLTFPVNQHRLVNIPSAYIQACSSQGERAGEGEGEGDHTTVPWDPKLGFPTTMRERSRTSKTLTQKAMNSKSSTMALGCC
jgi:hypothetical protein